MAKNEVVLIEILFIFSGKTDHIKIQKSTIKCTFRPPKRSETSGNKRRTCCLPVINESKESERKDVRVMAFAQHCGVPLTHHHGDF